MALPPVSPKIMRSSASLRNPPESQAPAGFFEFFPDAIVAELTKLGTQKFLEKGKYLYRMGSPRDKFYVLQEGLIRLTQKSAEQDTAGGTRFKTLGTFTFGDVLGETSFYIVDHDTHTTEALAVNDTHYLEFRVQEIQQFAKSKECEVQLQVAAGSIAVTRVAKKTITVKGFRYEKDFMGQVSIPKGSYYGIQTQRCLNVMSASGVPLSHYPALVRALCVVKKACSQANLKLGLLEAPSGAAICQACDEVLEGNLYDEFCVDMLQGGAGVSTMANANEVIANRATQLLGGELGEYLVNPNQHVNMSQSDDAYHTVMRLSLINSFPGLKKRMADAIRTLFLKAEEFKDVVKMGRTMLQDAVPTQLGREFLAWARQLEDDWNNLDTCQAGLKECLLGGTMLGTGLGAHPDFGEQALHFLREATGIEFQTPADLVKAATDVNAIVGLSSALRRIAVRVSKICNDLRLMSSGPRCGLKEINLPETQPGR